MHTFRLVNGRRERVRPRVGPCRHFGDEIRREDCTPCAAKAGRPVSLKVFRCATHGECAPETPLPGVACCAACPDYEPPDPFGGQPPYRNLLYHVYPRANGPWRRNVELLLRRVRLFDGRRVVAVAVDRTTDPPECVEQAFAGHAHEFIIAENDPSLREVKTFPELFGRLENVNPRSVTFYAHAKGVTYPRGHGWHDLTLRWAEILYEVNLDYWPLVEAALRSAPAAGAFKRHIKGWPASQSQSEWHYSGSFWWMRDADLFRKPDWRRIDRFWSGVEPYLSLHYRNDEAACLFHDFYKPGPGLYGHAYFRDVIEPELARWKAAHAADRKEW